MFGPLSVSSAFELVANISKLGTVKNLASVFMGKKARAVPSFSQVKPRLELSEPAPWVGMHPAHAPPLCRLHAAVDGGSDLHAFIGHLNVSLVT